MGISPTEWLQFGALGLLGLSILIGTAFIRSVLKDLLKSRDQERMALIEALQNNSVALTGLQVTQSQLVGVVQLMNQTIMGYLRNENAGKTEEKKKP